MSEEPGDACRVRLPHPEILNTLRVGDFLLLGGDSIFEIDLQFLLLSYSQSDLFAVIAS